MKFRTTLPLIFLLMTSGDFEEKWNVIYETESMCALKGSSVNMSCTYTYPQEDHNLTDTFWIKELIVNISLKDYPEYKDRVEYIEDRQNKTAVLRLNNVTENDERKYFFRFITDKDRWFGQPGIQLNVSGLQVQAPQLVLEKETLNLTCRTTCNLTDRFIWYKNGEALEFTSDILQLQSVRSDSGRYSCAVRGHEHLPSPAVSIGVEYDWRIGYIIIVCVSIAIVALFGLFLLLIIVVRRRKKIRNNDPKDSDNHLNDSRDIEQKKTSAGEASESGGEDMVLYASVKRHRNKAAEKPEEDEIQYASITVHHPAADAKSSADQEQDMSVIYSGIK